MKHRKIVLASGVFVMFMPLQTHADYWQGWRTLEAVEQHTGETMYEALVFSEPTEMCGAIDRVGMSVSCSADGPAVMIAVPGCSFSSSNGRTKVISQTDQGPLSEWSFKDFDGDKFIMMDVGEPPADFIKQLEGTTELQIRIDPVFGNSIAADFNVIGTEKAFSGIRSVCSW